MYKTIHALTFLTATTLIVCLPQDSKPSSRPAETSSEQVDFVLSLLKVGPNAASKPLEERNKIQAAHMANIQRLGKEGTILVAGPFGSPSPDKTSRGIFIFDVRTVEEADKLTATDPAVMAGVLIFESHIWNGPASLRKIRDLEKEHEATQSRSATQKPQLDIGSFVLAIAKDADRADKALVEARSDGKVITFGRFGGKRKGSALFILNVADSKAADSLVAPVRESMGEVEFFPWYTMKYAAKLAQPTPYHENK